MQHIQLAPDLTFSRLIQGFWRLKSWQKSPQELLTFIKQGLEFGIDTFDHAACYGSFTAEAELGRALALDKSLRSQLTLVTKCGILYPNDELSQIKSHHYDNSYRHIIWSAQRSIEKLQCEYLDVLLIHRLSPCADPEQIARAFNELHQSGKVRYFGVSNYTPAKFSMLQSYVNQPLITNQIEISPLHRQAFDDGTLDFLLEKRVKPMAWSPLAGGRLFNHDENLRIIQKTLLEIGETKSETRLDTLVYAWLLAHPAKIMPIIGSGKTERVKNAADALKISFTEEEWIKVYVAAQGHDIP
ncbi:oxidoreductase [Actinobacillus succinogenes]|uniref:Aldo/keto reductase n=1 Tax=Actinobacillus succinogenes (strain ATCC 55618 / DSM 22257 / CCUG 43843 / 130Z) TaxID=339671 RepID=A6VL42_ACTSZ|nr:aldo/keto reductase [Actinobacillus succinogenes]ABR73689.1 aldo/keto reductase [Actinobacillus succinogenes 130Z]PHI39852.1 oxidoreductase [Actinobacillus succinogenes]